MTDRRKKLPRGAAPVRQLMSFRLGITDEQWCFCPQRHESRPPFATQILRVLDDFRGLAGQNLSINLLMECFYMT